MSIKNSYNFRRVSAVLTTSGVIGPHRMKRLSEEGYQSLINLLPDTSEHAVENEAKIVEAQGVEYIYIPVDFRHPDLADYDRFAGALDTAKDKKIHIHCAANYRVSAFYALYSLVHGMWNESEAQEFILGIWNPEGHPGWPGFISIVKQEYLGTR